MGVSIVSRAATTVRTWFAAPRTLKRLALASIIGNVVIVITGGAVRLTDSGLGCPTWPRCNSDSLTPTRANATHGIIEFSNRTLTIMLTVVAVLTLCAAWSQRREVKLAALAFLVIPAQAVVGGITVLTDLNPWIVGLHFLVSMVILVVTVRLWHAVSDAAPASPAPKPLRILVRLTLAAGALVLVAGAIVTGAGPHAGDFKEGRVRRNGLDPGAMAQLHADVVMVLIGATLGLLVAVRLVATTAELRRAVSVLLVVELAQGVIGFVQYFTHLPVLAVGLHMAGACVVWVALLEVDHHATGWSRGQIR